jgi:cytochrome c-type biogenesis protein CcmF
MVVGHLGFAVAIIGITLVSNYNQEKHVRMAYGETVQLMGYDFTFNGVSNLQGPNYTGYQAHVVASQNGHVVANLEAEKRIYTVQRNTMTEAGIDSAINRDLFVALGEQLEDGDWALRIYVKPFVNWIWVGAFIMAFGGILSISDKRYRMQKLVKKKSLASTAQVNSSLAGATQTDVTESH